MAASSADLMKTISLVNRLHFSYSGNLLERAVCLGDLDNDGGNELAVGNTDGVLFVYKGARPKPWKTAHNLGMISALVIGDVLSAGRNFLTVIAGSGYMHVLGSGAPGLSELTPVHSQRTPSNVKTAILCDIDGDGNVELIVGMTDRILRSYRWVGVYHGGDSASGKFVSLNKWELSSQIGNVSVNYTCAGKPYVVASQPGGTYVSIEHSKPVGSSTAGAAPVADELEYVLKYHLTGNCGISRNSNITTLIQGNVFDGERNRCCALSTLDGTIALVEDDQVVWSVQVDNQVFSLTQLVDAGSGAPKVVVCCTDGTTYFIDCDDQNQCTKYLFDNDVCGFHTGAYASSQGSNEKCLVYATFEGAIILFKKFSLTVTDPTAFKQYSRECLNRNLSREQLTWLLYGRKQNFTSLKLPDTL